jgi:hypothetical protein
MEPNSLSIDEVIASAPDDHARHLYKMLVDEWGKLGHVVQPRSAGATFQADVGGQLQPIFWAFPRYVQALMSTLTRRGVPADVLTSYRSSLASLSGFDQRSINLTQGQQLTSRGSLRRKFEPS